MAICNSLSAGLDKSCDSNAGGVNKIYIGDFITLSPTITGGKITSLVPGDTTNVVSTTATVNITNVAGQGVTTTILISGNQTSVFTAGRYFKFTYTGQFSTGYWIGPVLSSSYNAGTNVTTITPDYSSSFAPILGAIGSIPSNVGNQTVSTWNLFEFKTNKNVCNFTESANIDMANGTTFFNQVVTLVLSRRETTKRNAIKKLADGQKQLIIVVLDSNGIYWLFGLNEGGYLTATEGGSGTAKADANGYTITLTAMEIEQAYEIDYAAISKYLV